MLKWNMLTLKTFYFNLLLSVSAVPAGFNKLLILIKLIKLIRLIYFI